MRNNVFLKLPACLLLFGFAGYTAAQSKPVPNSQLASKELNLRVESLLKKMTLDEKLGQLSQYSPGYAAGPGAANRNWDDLVAQG
jgi:beta-glucosidase